MNVPESSIDLFAEEALLDPFSRYKELRDLGPVVWFPQYEMFVLSRYQHVREAMRNWQVFSSAEGVMMNQPMNETLKGIVLCSDDPEHAALRRVVAKPLTPQAIQVLSDQIKSEAEALVDRLVVRKSFDAATELAQHLPISIVSNLVGLPDEGRERMLEWAAANFQCFGPLNDRTKHAFITVKEMVDYAFTKCVPGKLKPGGWAQMIWDAAERGEISKEKPPLMMNDYMGPSLDTTIFATSSAIWLFAQHPEQWDLLRNDPSLIPGAINEVVRLESPLQCFSRFTTQEHAFEGITIPANSRTIVLWGSANRDERKWEHPDRFDIRRRNGDHLGFGHGVHMCVGLHLAKMEISALLRALIRRVRRFELGATRRVINNVMRGFDRVEVTVR
jgi:cytochrome P450